MDVNYHKARMQMNMGMVTMEMIPYFYQYFLHHKPNTEVDIVQFRTEFPKWLWSDMVDRFGNLHKNPAEQSLKRKYKQIIQYLDTVYT